MPDADELLESWRSRQRPHPDTDGESMAALPSPEVAEVISSAIASVEKASPTATDAACADLIAVHASSVAAAAHSAKLNCCEMTTMLQGFQLVLLEQKTHGAAASETDEDVRQQVQSALQRTGQLADASHAEFRQLHSAALEKCQETLQAKTLQHEIRTPLQGALLCSELLLEDVNSGVPVSLDDVQSIRTSLETAIKVLNDFASR